MEEVEQEHDLGHGYTGTDTENFQGVDVHDPGGAYVGTGDTLSDAQEIANSDKAGD